MQRSLVNGLQIIAHGFPVFSVYVSSVGGTCRNFNLGAIAQEARDRSPPVAKPRWGSQKLRQLQTLFSDYDCRNDQPLKILHNSPPDSRPVSFTVGG